MFFLVFVVGQANPDEHRIGNIVEHSTGLRQAIQADMISSSTMSSQRRRSTGPKIAPMPRRDSRQVEAIEKEEHDNKLTSCAFLSR
jgi:pyruvate/2-oxoglutarate dehydrogenase complex dihydrolipoamide acyltransferase (E2) component